MDVRNNLSSSVAFGGLAEFSCQYDTTKPQLCLRGMSVQTLHSPCSAYFSRSNTDQNNIHSVNPLHKFRIVSQMETVPDSFDKLDLTVISGPVHDEYVPWSPDKETVDELFPILGNSLCSQSCLSENEPDTSEPTPANRWHPDHHLTNLPVELAYPQNSRQVAVVDSLNLLQVTTDSPMNSANIVADKSSQAQHRRKRRRNPAYAQRQRERQRERQRKRYQNDPGYAQRRRESRRKRCQNDPFYANGQRIYHNTYNRMRRETSREEASKLASVAREEYFRSVNSSEDSGNLPQTSDPPGRLSENSAQSKDCEKLRIKISASEENSGAV